MTNLMSQLAERILSIIAPQAILTTVHPLTGGISATMIHLQYKLPSGIKKHAVIRQANQEVLSRNQRTLDNEYQLLKFLNKKGLNVPAPIFYDPSGEILPEPYLVLSYAEGSLDFSPSDRTRYARQLAGQLAGIHSHTNTTELDFLPQHPGLCSELLVPTKQTAYSQFQTNQICIVLQEAGRAIISNQSVLLHGDFWPGNIIWYAGRVAAIVDWEDACIGDPLCDLAIARLDLCWIFDTTTMQAFTDSYIETTGRDITNLAYWDLCAALRLIRLAGADLDKWAAFFHPFNRSDITATHFRIQLSRFIESAFSRIANHGEAN